MIVLGVDPGLQVCGYAAVEIDAGVEKLIEAGVISTDGSAVLACRLNQIAGDMTSLLEKFGPKIVAVEDLYSHYKHPKTAILMGHARGVILQTAQAAEAEVKSFAATRIKKSLTGNGRASKEQMQRSIQSTLGLGKLPTPADVADAIAVALCCGHQARYCQELESD
ncbi:MAG: crossover junction endodeoxyribonuclease RuvC [Planctomycetota bacterium]|jgi:crossover junction endodeoxyribonuclease RuvC